MAFEAIAYTSSATAAGRRILGAPFAADSQREVRRCEEEADAGVGAAVAAGHLKGRADAADGDEAELAHRGRVPRARDVDGAESLERGAARLPVAEREQRVDGPA